MLCVLGEGQPVSAYLQLCVGQFHPVIKAFRLIAFLRGVSNYIRPQCRARRKSRSAKEHSPQRIALGVFEQV
jgi:hypothetical protein